MFFSTAILLPALLPFSLAAAVAQLQERDSCADVHVFMARGNGEDYPGRVGAIANTVCNGLPSCDSENILFVSTESYCDQASDGVASGLSQVAAYASRCPHSKLVLAGYSLGAQIVGDMLAGGGGGFYGCTERTNSGLSPYSSPGNQIAVVLMFGDVRHVANQPYNVGSGSGANGQYPRYGGDLSNLNQFSGKTQSYCISPDPICAGGNDGESHTTYMQLYADTAGAWAQQVLNLGGAASVSALVPPPTPTPTPTPTLPPVSTPIPSSPPTLGPESSSTTTSASSSLTSAASSTSSSTSSVQGTTTSSSSSTSSSSTSQNSASFTPFVFSNSASGATTSIFSNSATSTFSTKSTTSHITTATPTHSQPAAAVVSTSSKAGGYSNNAQLSLNFLTLVVIKVLAF